MLQNRKLDKDGNYYSMVVGGFRSSKTIYPGQFVHVKVSDSLDPYFRRAFSIAGYDKKSGELEIVYKIVGRGTARLEKYKKGEILDFVGPLGNRFTRPPGKNTVLIVAGGVGLPPLYFLARTMINSGFDPKRILFFYGGRSRDDLLEMPAIRRLGLEFYPATDDGSYGDHDLVTTSFENAVDKFKAASLFVYGCGPEPMLKTLQNISLARGIAGQLSLEAPMPCGVGVCLGCIKPLIENPGKYVRVCYDGPVFEIGEVEI